MTYDDLLRETHLNVDTLVETERAEVAGDGEQGQHLVVLLVDVLSLETAVLEELLGSLHVSEDVLVAGGALGWALGWARVF